MRTSRHLQLYSIIFLFLSTFTAAWPWPRWLPELDSLIVRQNNNGNNNNNDNNSAASSAPTQGSAKTSQNQNSPSQSGSTAPSPTKGTNSGSSSKGTSPKTTGDSNGNKGNNTATPTSHGTTMFDPRLPAGGISMITPAVIQGEQFYKIGDFVTFAWNYTSLLATPTAVNIMATCTANNQLYTIAANQTITNSTGAVTWDTGSYQATAVQDPLLTQTYTLIIYDADSSISAQAQAGYLAVYNQFTFGMYTPQPYTPLNEFKCATCSGALGDLERKALGFVVGMSVLTVLSFTWFVGGVGVIW